ncbi:MAG TPA: hypothetical protein VF296_06800 [Gallionella sp.]
MLSEIDFLSIRTAAERFRRHEADERLERLDSRLMKQLAIRLSWQTTPAKSLVMRGNDEVE